jgi:hypothetical protein
MCLLYIYSVCVCACVRVCDCVHVCAHACALYDYTFTWMKVDC